MDIRPASVHFGRMLTSFPFRDTILPHFDSFRRRATEKSYETKDGSYELSEHQPGAFGIIATILAIAATVVAFVMIVPESKRRSWPLRQVPHDAVNFKFLIVEKILQALYIFVTAYVILCGFFMLFMAPETWTGRHWLAATASC